MFCSSTRSECYSGTIDRFNYKIPTPEDIPLCIDPIDHPRFTYAVTKMLGESGFLNYSKMLALIVRLLDIIMFLVQEWDLVIWFLI